MPDNRLPEVVEGWPPGHFYSPIPSLSEVRRRESELFGPPPRLLPGIDLEEGGQLALLERLEPYYAELRFPETRQPGHRFHFDNPNYTSEAIPLFCLLRHLRPRRLVEIGSGYSSCAILDTNERFFAWSIQCTFVEPHPQLLESLLAPGDLSRVTLLGLPLQDVPASLFESLEANDILFVDSTHVAKIGSDVNRILFEILPRLAAGVYVHFHDIHYPFEYPREWIYGGRAWNEAYMVRAFLQHNSAFRVALFNGYLGCFHADRLRRTMPRWGAAPGASLWLRRL